MHPSSWIVPIPISPSIPGQQGLDPMSEIGSCLHTGIQNLLGSKTMEPNTWDVLGEWWLSPGSASQISIGRSDSFSMCQRRLPTPESGNARKIKYSFLLAFPVTPFCSRAFFPRQWRLVEMEKQRNNWIFLGSSGFLQKWGMVLPPGYYLGYFVPQDTTEQPRRAQSIFF